MSKVNLTGENIKMKCETCGQEVKGICEELGMTKREKLIYELGCEKGSRSSVFYIIIGVIIGAVIGYLAYGGFR